MKVCMQIRSDYSFTLGLLAGTVLGAGLAMWLAPKAAAEIRGRIMGTADSLRDRADDTIEDLTDRVNSVRDDLADAVVRGAKKVEHIAKAAKA